MDHQTCPKNFRKDSGDREDVFRILNYTLMFESGVFAIFEVIIGKQIASNNILEVQFINQGLSVLASLLFLSTKRHWAAAEIAIVI